MWDFYHLKSLAKATLHLFWLIDYSLNAAALPIALRLFSLSRQTASHVVYEACLHTSWGEKAYFYSPLPEGFDPKNSKISSVRVKVMKQHYTGTQEGTIYVLTFSPQQPQATVAINILRRPSIAKATTHQTKVNTCSERPATSTRLCVFPMERAGDRHMGLDLGSLVLWLQYSLGPDACRKNRQKLVNRYTRPWK